MQVQFKDTKFGRLNVGHIIFMEKEMGRFGLARVERIYDNPDPEKMEKHFLFHEIDEKGDTFMCPENLDTLEARAVKLTVVDYMRTREEWDEFLKFYKHHLLAQKIDKAGFPQGNQKRYY